MIGLEADFFKKTPAGQGQCIRSPVKCWTMRLDQDLGK